MLTRIIKKCFPILTWIVCSCSQPDVVNIQSTNSLIGNLRVYDIGNFSDAGDIYVRFNLSEKHSAGEIVLFIDNPSIGQIQPITSSVLDELASSMFLEIVPGKSFEIQLFKDLTDAQGIPIRSGIPYDLYVLAINTSGEILDYQRAPIILTNKNPIEGPYRGVWSDNLDGNIPVSVDLKYENESFHGSFFYTNLFEPCCGGPDDGQISMSVSFDDNIHDFRYDQFLNSFSVADSCQGVYLGTGQVVRFTRIELTYQGSDCVGDHVGSLILDKQ